MPDIEGRMREARAALQRVFGYDTFRNGQQGLVSDWLAGLDVLGVLPTGGGKSICYQLPALVSEGVTLVISPLISLMKDQVDALTTLGVPAAYINSSQDEEARRGALRDARAGRLKLLYIAPERLELDSFQELVQGIEVPFLAVDEAHCVSQWGHEFRPSYLRIRELIDAFPKRPVVGAYTATATPAVRQDIIELLGLRAPREHISSFDRPNLYFDVQQIAARDKADWIARFVSHREGDAGIVYCATRRDVNELTRTLCERGISALPYHAGIEPEERTRNQDAFLFDKVQLIIATNAFGMGIDKSNVRFVIHHGAAYNMEAYYQEAGRAGRDGEAAECVLLFNAADLHKRRRLIEMGEDPEQKKRELYKLESISRWMYGNGCYRAGLLRYFGEDAPERCGHCGSCRRQEGPVRDVTEEAQMLFSCIKRTGERLGASVIARILTGSPLNPNLTNESTYGLLRGKWSREEVTDFLRYLSAEGYLHVAEGLYPTLSLTARATPVLRGQERIEQPVRPRAESKREKRYKEKQAEAGRAPLTEEEEALFSRLRKERLRISDAKHLPPYMIFSDATLIAMVRNRPNTIDELLSLPGIGERKLQQYGAAFLDVLRGEAWAEESGKANDKQEPPEWEALLERALEGESVVWHEPPNARALRVIAARSLAENARELAERCHVKEDALMLSLLSALLRD